MSGLINGTTLISDEKYTDSIRVSGSNLKQDLSFVLRGSFDVIGTTCTILPGCTLTTIANLLLCISPLWTVDL